MSDEDILQDRAARESEAAKRIAAVLDELRCDLVIEQRPRAAGPLLVSEAVLRITAK